MTDYSFVSLSGIVIDRVDRKIDFQRGIDFMIDALNNTRGAFLSSGVEDQDRYSRWEFGFIDPPLEIVAHAEQFRLTALNPRGVPLLAMLKPLLLKHPDIELKSENEENLVLTVARPDRMFAEEERSRQPSTFTPIRALMAEFNGMNDEFLGLWGAFGFDLIYEFEQMPLSMPRTEDDKLLHLYLPDRIMVMDRRLEVAFAYEYEFTRRALTTHGMGETAFTGVSQPSSPNMASDGAITSDHSPEDYMGKVDGARERIRVGDIFEVVLSRKYQTAYHGPPSEMFRLMQRINPSPYEFFFQFANEQLIGASPEMFVRVDGDRVESSPISGTARRGDNAMEDAERILALYNSWKDEVELTMCTDVDRNDKSRICRPGTIKLLARRAIERYAGLFHTVDHVEGRMREGFDGIDAFLSHMWAVTLTGAPKRKAVQIIEDVEVSPRRWYGGAIGALMFSGTVNTGITIRTVHLENGRADYRVGATLVWDSVPAEEEEETKIKSTAFFKAVASLGSKGPEVIEAPAQPKYTDVSIIMVDNEDSFVHTLADYFRQTGAEVKTFRHGAPALAALAEKPDLVIHSPGPGQPRDFGVPDLVRTVADLGIPQFGICLGLQGMVEAFGGELTIMDEPRHGKYWQLSHDGSGIFDGIEANCRVGGYHSLLAVSEKIPDELDVIARNEHDMVMAIKHQTLPLAAVQFHPESILSMDNQAGLQIVENVLATLLPEKGAAEQAA
ncbi:MAG: anthranilate synthase component I [Rhodospirillaceae bacterium]|jgi:anthranilate synthase|nr:anthranilate synthase component I [Rhodospirillaceae bacterium]MBT3492390.1 anthranilate synthase component I [Rhodospirillaceae bacterium]MBT3978710.1 anthranilate synthase component I [Rhodospirillaceae bacterium]MBT4168482.1 anthranilate synthase component I [Rhodospirillaceae bacterium]MBT4564914.1 anthranilate synthase component I [Rhodospirillaceae bacterium]